MDAPFEDKPVCHVADCAVLGSFTWQQRHVVGKFAYLCVCVCFLIILNNNESIKHNQKAVNSKLPQS